MSDLNSFATPVVSSQLEHGEIYFMLNYLDNQMLVPDIKTLVFLGRNLAGDSDSLLYFQDIGSFPTIGPISPSYEGQSNIFHCEDDQLKGIFLLENAIDELLRCAKRRSKRMPGPYEFCDNQEPDPS